MFAVFLDRDGVINEEVSFLRHISNLAFIPGSIEALARLSSEFPADRCKLIIVTNQSMIARGMTTEDAFQRLSDKYMEAVHTASGGAARIDDTLYCPHHPTEGVGPYRVACDCRKPATGMFTEARNRHGITLGESYMIGDRATDILAGQAAGCFSIMVRTGYGGDDGSGTAAEPDAWCDDLAGAAELIIGRVRA